MHHIFLLKLLDLKNEFFSQCKSLEQYNVFFRQKQENQIVSKIKGDLFKV